MQSWNTFRLGSVLGVFVIRIFSSKTDRNVCRFLRKFIRIHHKILELQYIPFHSAKYTKNCANIY